MTFLQPWAVWFLAGIPVIVLLYFLRLKRREISVSTHLFWQRVLQESSRRAFFHRLRHWWSLLLQILIFLLIAAALAKPLWNQSAASASNIVVIVDSRARMNAVEPDGKTRFAKAIDAARSWIRQANAGTQVALVSIADTARVVVPFTDDESELRKALEAMRPTDAAGNVATGTGLAAAILSGRPGSGQTVLLTDHTPAATNEHLTVQAFGSSLDNFAITRFATRPHPASPETAELLLELQNFSKAPADVTVELALDGRVFEVRPMKLEPAQARLEVLSSVPRPGRGSKGWLTARLKANDALASDNIAYATHPARPPRRVLLVSEGNLFLEKLLAADPSTRFQFIQPAAWKPDLAEKFEAVIFDRFLPQDFKWEAAAGSYFVLGINPFGVAGTTVDRPLITEVADTDPATRGLQLQNLTIQKAEIIPLPASTDGWQFRAPLRSFKHPMLIMGTRGKQHMAVLSFNVLESDLPLRVAFPLLVSHVLQELDSRNIEAPPALKAGETIALRAGERASIEPVAELTTSPPPLQTSTFLHPLQNGFYRTGTDEQSRWVAVNTFDPVESDLRAPTMTKTSSAAISTPTSSTGSPWPLWTWLTLAALGLFTCEWWLFHRRRTE